MLRLKSKMHAQMPRVMAPSGETHHERNRHHYLLAHLCMSHDGFSVAAISSLVKTASLGIRLTRYAPLRMAPSCTFEIPLLLLRILPASLMLSGSLILLGGAKSSPVKVPDLRSTCGLGMAASSSKALTVGVNTGTAGEYGRRSPNGLSDLPAALSR